MAANRMKAIYCAICLLILSPIIRSQSPGPAAVSLRGFANRFYQQATRDTTLSGPAKTFVCSPASIAIMLALLAQGSLGDTQLEMLEVLYASDKDTAKNIYKDMIVRMSQLSSVTLRIANKIYVQNTYNIDSGYYSEAINGFKTSMANIDFSYVPNSGNIINIWVNSMTAGTVSDIVDPFTIYGSFRLLPISTLYFQGNWDLPFPVENNREEIFTLSIGKQRKVDMMAITETFKWGEINQLAATAVEMFYEGGQVSMVIILPNQFDGLPILENYITPSTNWRVLLDGLTYDRVSIAIPKFKAETLIDVKQVLSNFETTRLYNGKQAQFDPISINNSPIDRLHVNQHQQKVVLDFNEQGTNVPGPSTAQSINKKPIKEFLANRPFMYLIRDYHGHILFMGNYN